MQDPRPTLEKGNTVTTQPIIFDLIHGVVLHVGQDPEADKRYAELVAAQQAEATTAAGFAPRDK